jgi:hypothetical protein
MSNNFYYLTMARVTDSSAKGESFSSIGRRHTKLCSFFERFRGRTDHFSVNYKAGELVATILAELSQRTTMPLSYFMPPFHRLRTGETLITRKHKLLGLSRDVSWRPLMVEDSFFWII